MNIGRTNRWWSLCKTSSLYEKKNKYYIVYHRRPLTETDGNHRVTCIDEMKFDANGMILPVVITNEGVKAQKVK